MLDKAFTDANGRRCRPDEPVAALFEVKDSGIGGQLSGTSDRDTTTFVVAGQG